MSDQKSNIKDFLKQHHPGILKQYEQKIEKEPKSAPCNITQHSSFPFPPDPSSPPSSPSLLSTWTKFPDIVYRSTPTPSPTPSQTSTNMGSPTKTIPETQLESQSLSQSPSQSPILSPSQSSRMEQLGLSQEDLIILGNRIDSRNNIE